MATAIPAGALEFDRRAQIKLVLLILAFAAVFYRVLLTLTYYWRTSSDWSHGWIIPFFSAYLISTKWDQIRRIELRGNWVGFLIMLGGLGLYWYSLWGLKIGYIRPTSMLVCLLGMAIFLCGLPVVRHAWLPWLYLFFAVPLPKGVYFQLTDPLRRIAAEVATAVLGLFNSLHIEKVGSTIEYLYQGETGYLGVADACSGMRSTITLCALGVAVTFISDRPWWQRVIMIGSCIPIAVFSNFIRVTATCLLHIFVDPKYAEGEFHTMLGLVTLLIAFGIFGGLGWLLNNLTVEADASPEGAEAA